MHLVEVDPLCFQSFQRSVTGIDDVSTTEALCVSVCRVSEVKLRCEDDVFSPVFVFQRLADDTFTLVACIDIRCVNEVYAAINRVIDHSKRVCFVTFSSKHHCTKAELTDLNPCAAKWSVLHVGFSPLVVICRPASRMTCYSYLLSDRYRDGLQQLISERLRKEPNKILYRDGILKALMRARARNVKN